MAGQTELAGATTWDWMTAAPETIPLGMTALGHVNVIVESRAPVVLPPSNRIARMDDAVENLDGLLAELGFPPTA
jgi:hypothetical protein